MGAAKLLGRDMRLLPVVVLGATTSWSGQELSADLSALSHHRDGIVARGPGTGDGGLVPVARSG